MLQKKLFLFFNSVNLINLFFNNTKYVISIFLLIKLFLLFLGKFILYLIAYFQSRFILCIKNITMDLYYIWKILQRILIVYKALLMEILDTTQFKYKVGTLLYVTNLIISFNYQYQMIFSTWTCRIKMNYSRVFM